MSRLVQNAGHRSRSQVTESAIKKLDTLLGFSCSLVSFPFTSQSGTCLASTMLPVVLGVKELNGESYTLYWMELEELLLMFGCLENWKRDFVFAPCQGTWKEVLRQNAFLTIDCTAKWVADFGLLLHTLLGFEDSSSILKPFKLWKRS